MDEALRQLIAQGKPITPPAVKAMLGTNEAIPAVTEVRIDAVELQSYDGLFDGVWEAACEPVLS